MKKLLSILIILSTLLTLVACGWSESDDDVEDNDNQTEQTPDDTPDEPVETVALNLGGRDIESYTIVYDEEGLDYNKRAAEYIRDQIAARTNKTLSLVDDSEPAGAYEIVVGETSRDISGELDAETEGLEFAILSLEGSVALEGDYFVIAAAAYYFVDTYLITTNENNVIPEGVSIHTPIVEEAKNYIFLIGDGMGVYQTQLFDYLEDVSEYSDGEDLFYAYMLPYQGYSKTSSFTGVTDSAASATAMATGYKTYNKYVGLDKDGNSVKSITELAGEKGLATAVMSTENKTGATPSAFTAHTINRDNKNEILDCQTALTAQYGTVIDCGYDYYTARYMATIERHITETLAKVDADEDGFFLMYEEAYIDKHSAKADMDKTFLALIRFNQAIARFMEYAFYNPDTMVIITADHETGGLLPDGKGGLEYTHDDHTAADVPVFAWGVGAEYFDGKTIENIEIAHFLGECLGDESFGDRTGDWYDEIYGPYVPTPDDDELPLVPVKPV